MSQLITSGFSTTLERIITTESKSRTLNKKNIEFCLYNFITYCRAFRLSYNSTNSLGDEICENNFRLASANSA